ncbi:MULTISPECIES: helix-turn-helix domain-containing protein [Streptomyces]|uniref:winged helix-turn-helix domain-containing protein n=1 Tax=Streptomyces TaxID=1883 RepID=UPI0004C966B2|nr:MULTISPECIES: helix-turn-helix domain-containing protein [Streptomyces]RPK94020.1 hypothetical protein EES46_03575 [Streptomyces sp. ADI98-10]
MPGTPKGRLLLAVLLSRPGRPVTEDALVEAVWGEEQPKGAAPREFATKGASYETWALSARKSAPVTGAEFDEGDAYSHRPVVRTSRRPTSPARPAFAHRTGKPKE